MVSIKMSKADCLTKSLYINDITPSPILFSGQFHFLLLKKIFFHVVRLSEFKHIFLFFSTEMAHFFFSGKG